MATEIELELELVLEPGEVVLWSGRPHYPYFRSEAWAAFVFGLIALVAASAGWLISFLAVRDLVTNGNTTLIPALIALIATCGFSAVAFELLRTPWVCHRSLARACYAVTNRRVIVRAAPGYDRNGMLPELRREQYLFTPEQARACATRRRHGQRVDLVLGREYHIHRGRRSVVEIGILGAEDWQGAEQAIKTAFPR